jgi:hypothetical protein
MKIKKIIINERQYKLLETTILNEYKEYLKEEMGVAKEVEFVSDYIEKKITKMLPELDRINNTIFSSLFVENCGFIGMGKVYFNAIPFKNMEEYTKKFHISKLGAYIRTDNINFDENNKLNNVIIQINFPILNGRIVTNLFNSAIFHEVEHLYQIYRTKYNKIHKNTQKRQNNYKNAFNILQNNSNPNTYEVKIATLIYLSNTMEQDAFSSQLYAFFKANRNDEDGFESLWKQSVSYGNYQELLKLQKEIPSWVENNDSITAKNKFYSNQLNFKTFKNNLYNLVTRTIKRYYGKMLKVYTKARKDFCNESIGRNYSLLDFLY